MSRVLAAPDSISSLCLRDRVLAEPRPSCKVIPRAVSKLEPYSRRLFLSSGGPVVRGWGVIAVKCYGVLSKLPPQECVSFTMYP